MKLTLSSAAAPGETLQGLLDACGRKGIAGLELVEGDGHGMSLPSASRLAELRALVHAAHVALTSFRLATGTDVDEERATRVGTELDVPVLVPVTTDRDMVPVARAAERLSAAGVRVGAASADAALLIRCARMGPPVDVAWDVAPERSDPDDLARLLDAVGPGLTHVRLFGGGPESAGQAGTGVGRLMSRLARARFSGALVITPSTRRYRVAWSAWLGRSRGWGCSGKATRDDPIRLEPTGGDR